MRHITATGYKLIAKVIKIVSDDIETDPYLSKEDKINKKVVINTLVYCLCNAFGTLDPRFNRSKFIRLTVKN